MTKAVSLARSVSDTGLLLDSDLAAIAALSGTTGLLKKDSANTWSLDTTSYLTGNQTLTFSGDATGTGTTAITITLANSGVSAGSYGSATNIPAITVDSKGRITSVTNTAVSIPSGSLTFTGDVTGNGTTGSSTSLTLASVGTSGTYTKVTTDAKGRVTSGTTLASSDLPTYTGTLTSSQITTALGFTPENLANKAVANGYASLDSTGKVPTAQLSGFVDQTKPNIRPTLNLDFANSKIVDSRITFTRTTTASYYDLQGTLKYAQPDESRIDHDPSTGECKGLLIEEQRTNLVNVGDGRYKEIEASEGNDGLTVRDCAAIAPDGTMSAAFVAQDSGTPTYNYLSFTSLSRSGSTPIPINTTFTASIYVKSAGAGYFRMGAPWNSSNYSGVQFNLTTGAVQVSYATTGTGYSLTNPFITPVGNGWYRVGFTGVVTAGASNPTFTPMLNVWNLGYSNNGSTGNGVDGVYVWGAQIELAPFATSKITVANTFTSRASSATYFDSAGILRLAGTNQPRYGYGYDSASGKWVSQGLVLESAATNYISYADFSSSWWDKAYSAATATITPEVSPNGDLTAFKLSRSTTGEASVFRGGISLADGSTYTTSVYAKASGSSLLRITNTRASSGADNVEFNLQTGTITYVGATSLGSITPVGNGWYRCSATSLTTSGNQYAWFAMLAGSASDYLLLWNPQIETGSVATSYIPTYGATATRAADISSSASTTRAVDSAVIKSSEFTKLNSSTAGTLYGEGTIISGTALVGGAPALVALSNSVDRDTHRFILRRTNMTGDATYAGFNYRLATVINGTSYSIDYSAAEGAQPEWEDSAVHKTIFAVDTTSQQAYGDGISAGITSISIPSFDKLDQVEIGQGGSSSSWNGHIRKIAYYNKRLSNTQLQALTQ